MKTRLACLLLIAGVLGLVVGCATTQPPKQTEAHVEEGIAEPTVVKSVMGRDSLDLVFVPQPREIAVKGEWLRFDAAWLEQIEGAPSEGVEQEVFSSLAAVVGTEETAPALPDFVQLRIDPSAVPQPQGYALEVSHAGIELTGHDEAGLFYAAMTLRQLARQTHGLGALPCLSIRDWPDFANRGVMLDISRDKVPQMRTLYELVDRLAEWKINQLQLYTEHTFAYEGHHVVWEHASPMTPRQVRDLDAYCRARYVELVPNQNSFGHMGRWLQHDEYAHLSETGRGGGDLCAVDPQAAAFLDGLYDDLLPNFTSDMVNVGCDETWSLGRGRSAEACRELGEGRVYLNFLLEIHRLVSEHGKTMQFWGDIIMKYPELIPELPRDSIALEWGYEATHPFAEHGQRFADAGIPFYVCPGTSSWNTIAGRTDNAVGNLRNAASNGLRHGASGYLITDWGDNGHWQFLPVSYLGFACGAGLSWCVETNEYLNLPRVLDVHAFEDKADVMGRLAYDLGNAYQQTDVIVGNASILVRVLLGLGLRDGHGARLTAENLRETDAYIERVMAPLERANMARDDAELVKREFALAAELLRFACRTAAARIDAGRVTLADLPEAQRAEFAAELADLLPRYRQLWLARNRSGGLVDSAGRLEKLLDELR